MNTMLLKLYVKFQDLKNREEGQDLIEYALLAALLSLGLVAGIGTVVTALNGVYARIVTALGAAG
jgi:Flp pilus assembly pilin Flp